jgi:hypothetical protein
MSPLVERPRENTQRHAGQDQHWAMLAYESLSAGAMALLVGMGAVLTVVGVYVLFVWPLTFWDLADSGLEKYSDLARLALWSVFAGGSLAGYWYFSGAAFKPKAKPKSPARNGNGRGARH